MNEMIRALVATATGAERHARATLHRALAFTPAPRPPLKPAAYRDELRALVRKLEPVDRWRVLHIARTYALQPVATASTHSTFVVGQPDADMPDVINATAARLDPPVLLLLLDHARLQRFRQQQRARRATQECQP